MIRLSIILFLNFCLLNSCVEKYDLDLSSKDQRIVIEATLSNDSTQCLVRITKSEVNIDNNFDYNHFYEPVRNALVILTDDMGQIDTAIAIDPPPSPLPDSIWSHRIFDYYKFGIIFNYNTMQWDTVTYSYQNWGGVLDMVWSAAVGFKGYYTTTKFTGIAGRTFRLNVKAEGKEYIAEAYMPPTVPTIDSIRIKQLTAEADGEPYVCPFIYFTEPQNEKNYYMVSLLSNIFLQNNGANGLPVSLIDDNFLPAYVNGIPVLNEKNIGMLQNWEYQVYIYSLTEEAYYHYKNFFQQINTDGGAYSPAPANLKGNFSNGALGYFRASAVKVKRIIPDLK